MIGSCHKAKISIIVAKLQLKPSCKKIKTKLLISKKHKGGRDLLTDYVLYVKL